MIRNGAALQPHWRARSAGFHILTGVLLCIAGTSPAFAGVNGADEPIRVYIDGQVWPEVALIDWPGQARTIGVLFNASATSQICGKPLSAVAREKLAISDIVFGVACGELFVLMKKIPIGLSGSELELIAAHEAIHSVALATTRRTRLDIAGAGREAIGAKREESNAFFVELIRAFSRDDPQAEPPCSGLHERFDNLRGPELAFVNDQINVEWPAEFFMRLYGSIEDDDEYAAFRRKISRGNVLEVSYLAGGLAMVRIDNALGREAWQRRANGGESLTDLLFEALGCSVPEPPDQLPLASVRGILPNLVLD